MTRCSEGEFEYLADNSGKLLILRLFTLHEPGKEILVLTGHKLLEALPVLLIQTGVAGYHERFQYQVKLQHAAPAGPAHAVDFFLGYGATHITFRGGQSRSVYRQFPAYTRRGGAGY
mgnify:FL=1